MSAGPAPRRRGLELAFVVGLGILFAFTIWQSWGATLDPIPDTGRDLYIPEKIAEGSIELYTDVSYLYPPVAPYLLAAIVKVAGSNLTVMRIVGVTISAIVALLLFLIGRRVAGAIAAAVLTFLFITIHMTGVSGYSFNFIFPYSHNAVFGFAFLLLFLLALLKHATKTGSDHWLWVAMVAGTAAGWCKIEYAAVFILMVCASFLVRRQPVAPIVAAVVANLSLLGIATAVFRDAPPERHWLTGNVLPESLLGGDVARQFYAKIQGLDTVGPNLAIAATGALLIILAVLSLAGIERLRQHPGRSQVTGTVLLALVFLATQIGLTQHYLLYRGWFLIQLLVIPWAVRERKKTPFFLLLLFSLLIGYRILLRLDPGWYGFLFSIPAEIVIVYLLLEGLPQRGIYRRSLALSWIPLFVIVGCASLVQQHDVYAARRSNEVTTPKGTYYDRLSDRAEILGEVFEILSRRQPASMVVLPEGLAVNWLSGVPTSIPYHTFNPAEMPDAESQQLIIDALRKDPPEIVLHLRRDYGEFGYVGLGVDYGRDLMKEMLCEYEPVWQRQDERFYAVILERRPSRECP